MAVEEIDLARPTLVLLGNEGAGLPSDMLGAADARIAVPMRPGVESLNVAVTAALVLYEARRQRR
jgi:TrmH family RNA methyltransferase